MDLLYNMPLNFDRNKKIKEKIWVLEAGDGQYMKIGLFCSPFSKMKEPYCILTLQNQYNHKIKWEILTLPNQILDKASEIFVSNLTKTNSYIEVPVTIDNIENIKKFYSFCISFIEDKISINDKINDDINEIFKKLEKELDEID